VRAILWREIGRMHAKGDLPGRMNQIEWLMTTIHGNEEQVAIGRKPDEYKQAAFQGLHQKFMLFVFDEACGIPLPLWVAAESLIANDNGKALVIGNPDDPLTEFGRVCKNDPEWNVIQIGAFDTPNFTGEEVPDELREHLIGRRYVESMRKRWAATWQWNDEGTRLEPPAGSDPKNTNPYFQSKVLGLFPSVGNPMALIPLQWVERAKLKQSPREGIHELGGDVGGGGDSSTVCERHGEVFRIIREDTNPDTMQTCGNFLADLESTGADCIKVDMIGIGRGVVDRGQELEKPVLGINVGTAPYDDPELTEEEKKLIGPGFVNLRAQLWWNVRTLFEHNLVDLDPEDEQLAAELVEIRFKRTSTGKIQVESKSDMMARGVPSPNRADALMLAAAPPQAVEEDVLDGCVVW